MLIWCIWIICSLFLELYNLININDICNAKIHVNFSKSVSWIHTFQFLCVAILVSSFIFPPLFFIPECVKGRSIKWHFRFFCCSSVIWCLQTFSHVGQCNIVEQYNLLWICCIFDLFKVLCVSMNYRCFT